ncbi:trypsin-like peptidase domain-containing protein [Paracoccus spongiarum]|uniref:Trypsin-like peptidase domain-containing protein n=1 Tax=Paracoccus spongiarum TaxID=3064387 RepID=A0ABT9JA21_9RHOB|nr:trypsin-like peptidase domain-containing protein [Paracoccus sp. 2205BS29-5]MDP5306666.1 trypsin-like peptidase domain-containing protein [Paracoccus sp. 2205BS29-5]
MAWNGYLDAAELIRVRDALIAADLFSPEAFRALLSVLPAGYRALLPGNPGLPPAMQIDQILRAMNLVVNLRGGEVPMRLVLAQAADYAADAAQRDLFEDMAAQVVARRPAPAGANAAAGSAAAAAVPAQPTAMARLAAAMPSLAGAEVAPEAVIGELDTTLSVNFLAGGLAAAGSVFKIVVQRHFDGAASFTSGDTPDASSGTAWMFRPGIGITNHHVLNARTGTEPDAAPGDLRLQAETARLIADFRDEADERPGLVLGPGSLIHADKTLDYALFRVPDELAQRPALGLRRHPIRKTGQQKIGDRVNLLQHPMGRPMRLGFRNNFVVLGNNDMLAYLTDTNRGSSGAPVFDDSWAVAALHVGSQPLSVPEFDLMGVTVRRENFGVPVQAILADLAANAPAALAAIGGAV